MYDIGQVRVEVNTIDNMYSNIANFTEPKNISYSFNKEKGGTLIISNCSIHQLGVQGIPGTIITINGSSSNVLIGQTGIFELNLMDATPIKDGIQITLPTVENISILPDTFYLLIDIVYSGTANQGGESI